MAAKVSPLAVQANDDVLTVVAISFAAETFADVLHEGLGHAAVALLTGAKSGVLSTVAWSGEGDSRLVAAGGTLANLAAALVFWFALCKVTRESVRLRFFLLTSLAFNLFAGTGYFFFSGLTNFGDWAAVIDGLPTRWLWRSLLVVGGIASYYGAVLVVGTGLVRYVGVPRNDLRRLRKLTWIPYFSAVVLLCVAGLFNPIGFQLVWQSALPAAAGAHSGLLWLIYYIPRGTVPERGSDGIDRSHVWIVAALVLSLVFVFVLGRGITLRGRLIPLNQPAFDALAKWAGRLVEANADDFVFPACEAAGIERRNPDKTRIDASRPITSWRSAWRAALQRAGLQIRFHDLATHALRSLQSRRRANTPSWRSQVMSVARCLNTTRTFDLKQSGPHWTPLRGPFPRSQGRRNEHSLEMIRKRRSVTS